LKPADLAPATARALADIIVGAGIPPGVFNLVMGHGSTVGQALEHKDVAAISFTGSVTTGRTLQTPVSLRIR
jgi:acyl-CoA reductase-like NAD-dependent aldehyde dehydrogenase